MMNRDEWVTETHSVPTLPEGERVRISDYAVGIFEMVPTRKGIKKAIQRDELLVNHAPTTSAYWVVAGDVLTLRRMVQAVKVPYRMPLEVVYEDDFLAVINKPAGVAVSGNLFRTVENALPLCLKISDAPMDGLGRLQATHRLDVLTSGLLLVAKRRSALVALREQFAQQRVRKIYEAIVTGELPEAGSIRDPIDGKPAHTDFVRRWRMTSEKYTALTGIELYPQTGRTHQIRKHLANCGAAVAGDVVYAPHGKTLTGRGLFLCATGLAFAHPQTGEWLEFRIAPPRKFERLRARGHGSE